MNSLENARILITGAAGFIGSHLSEKLLAEKAHVIAFDNFDPFYARQEKETNLATCRAHSEFTLIEGDICDRNSVLNCLEKYRPEIIIHLAARAGVRPSLEDPEGYADVNVRGTTVLLEAAHTFGIRQFIFASSSSVYGNQGSGPLREDFNTDTPLSPYGATKKSGELLCHTYHYVHGMSIACLRFFTVYGPRQRPDLAIRKFVSLAMSDKEIPVFGDDTSRRDYTHISDIISGILGAVKWVTSPQPRFGIFNLGSAHPISLHDLLDMIERYVGSPLKRQLLPPQPGDVYQTFADTSRAEVELGFRHRIAFDDGLRDFVAWMKEQSR